MLSRNRRGGRGGNLLWACGVFAALSACGGQAEDSERDTEGANADSVSSADTSNSGETASDDAAETETSPVEATTGDDGASEEAAPGSTMNLEPSTETATPPDMSPEDMVTPGTDVEEAPEAMSAEQGSTPDEVKSQSDPPTAETPDVPVPEVTDGAESQDPDSGGEMDTEPAATMDDPATINSPPTLDDITISPGDVAHPLCDLGGGVPVVKACVPVSTADCAGIDFDTQDVMDIANDSFDCGHPWIAGIICGPALSETESECCWEMDGHCQEDQMLPTNPREVHSASTGGPPPGCDGEDPEATPDFPITSGDFVVEPGDWDNPICDLGGGRPRVRVCAPLISEEEGCHDLIYDRDEIRQTAVDNYTCDGSWGAGIHCGPTRYEAETGPACCWELDG